MAMRTILSPAQRAALFDPPDETPAVERLYTLGPGDLAETVRRRRAPNRLGFAVQLSYLRHPGRALEPGERPPPALLQVLAHQLGCDPAAFTEYASRETTLREHRAEIEAWMELRGFERRDRPAMLAIALDAAASTDRSEVIVGAMTRRLRETRITLPTSSHAGSVSRSWRGRKPAAKPSWGWPAISHLSRSRVWKVSSPSDPRPAVRGWPGRASGRRRRAPPT